MCFDGGAARLRKILFTQLHIWWGISESFDIIFVKYYDFAYVICLLQIWHCLEYRDLSNDERVLR